MAETFGAEKLGFHLEVIDPAQFSCPYHYHAQDEELFLALEGEAVVRCADTFYKVVAGDLFFYPTGPAYAHHMHNPTDQPFKFLALSNVSAGHDDCYYPDSGKVMTEEGVMQNGQRVNYYQGEENPALYWPKEWLHPSLH